MNEEQKDQSVIPEAPATAQPETPVTPETPVAPSTDAGIGQASTAQE